ncbi:type IV toxin-antitoxin system AbiEi family antitoxin domain-containing protein [Nevskia ramosa]|uniref:type IV toxin-antitoxin system AbiEi family antitoxin domain-containing protein n=1 Tax=Nevskia ramosa TaxID=64002 RepID=UPI0009FF6D4C|nr:type IV toxin-antitoxin system AbiEi family antitoxin domain-containing protein [Nevskia ramosa]
MSSKLNLVLQRLPRNAVVTAAWLRTQGIDRNLTAHYLRSGWLVPVGTGAYARAGESVDWPGGVHGLQHDGVPIWIAGQTALDLLGYGQNIAMGAAPVHLFARPKTRVPTWFAKANWTRPVSVQKSALFSTLDGLDASFKKHVIGELSITIAAAERAVFELAHAVHDEPGFEALDHAMQGLMGLRPSLMQALLQACAQVRVTRLVLLLGEHHRHPWVSRIDLASVDRGSGKRHLWPGSAIHRIHQISVPKGFVDGRD